MLLKLSPRATLRFYMDAQQYDDEHHKLVWSITVYYTYDAPPTMGDFLRISVFVCQQISKVSKFMCESLWDLLIQPINNLEYVLTAL